jgi:hypothetical protein
VSDDKYSINRKEFRTKVVDLSEGHILCHPPTKVFERRDLSINMDKFRFMIHVKQGLFLTGMNQLCCIVLYCIGCIDLARGGGQLQSPRALRPLLGSLCTPDRSVDPDPT